MKNPISTSVGQWEFKKNCSFTPQQVGLFYMAQSMLSFIVAGFFMFQGIWIIFPFTLLELFVLAIALLCYARHATDYELITLYPSELHVEISIAQKTQNYIFNSAWVQLDRRLNPKKLICIRYQGKQTEIGRFIHASLREKFLFELGVELRKHS